MGGFSQAISQGASKLAGAAATVLEHTQSVERIFERSDEGIATLDRLKNVYYPTLNQAKETLSKQALERAKLDPAKPKVDMADIEKQARKVARQKFMGPKDAFGVMAAQGIEQKKGLMAAQSYSNAVAFVLKDFQDQGPIKVKDPVTGQVSTQMRAIPPRSPFKMNVQKSGVPLTSVAPSYFPKTKNSVERAAESAIYTTFAPLIAIPHVATLFNGLFGASPTDFLGGLAKSIGHGTANGIDSFHNLVVTGAFAESYMRDIDMWNTFHATGKNTFTGSTAGYYVYKMFHQPGFSALRDYTLLSGANVGKMTAESVAEDFVKNPQSKKLAFKLTQLGLDPQAVLKQNGQLSQADMGTAIYRFVNDHYFLDNTLQRSMFLQGTPTGRILGTFHGYVTRQSKLMYQALVGTAKRGDISGLAKNLATAGLILPAMGEGIKTVERAFRGQKITPQEDVENVMGAKGPQEAMTVYLEALAHVGAFGVYAHLMNGALKHDLVANMAGPVISSPINLAQDITSGVRATLKGTNRNRPNRNWEQTERDLLFDAPGVSILGQMLSHRMLPTSKEHPDRDDPARQLYEYFTEDQTTPPASEGSDITTQRANRRKRVQ